MGRVRIVASGLPHISFRAATRFRAPPLSIEPLSLPLSIAGLGPKLAKCHSCFTSLAYVLRHGAQQAQGWHLDRAGQEDGQGEPGDPGVERRSWQGHSDRLDGQEPSKIAELAIWLMGG
eukprot:7420354-Pyramimonas_sp.AAC.1